MNLRQNDSPRTRHRPKSPCWLQSSLAPAKVNLLLDVHDRDSASFDFAGYHPLSTLMVPVRLYDSLSFESIPGDSGNESQIKFTLRDRDTSDGVPGDERNLVVRALRLLRERSGCEMGARVALVKRIPSGAGLGGGSSDAAAALMLANRGWGIDWSADRLSTLAAELGSDVPFFLDHGGAICRARGEQVERIPGLRPFDLVIVKPAVALSTAEVYRRFDELPGGATSLEQSERTMCSLLADLRRGAIGQLGRWMGNGLQAAAASLSSWVERLASAFAELGFAAHQLSGSGSAYFGVCRHASQARRLASILRSRGLGRVFVTRSGF